MATKSSVRITLCRPCAPRATPADYGSASSSRRAPITGCSLTKPPRSWAYIARGGGSGKDSLATGSRRICGSGVMAGGLSGAAEPGSNSLTQRAQCFRHEPGVLGGRAAGHFDLAELHRILDDQAATVEAARHEI